MSDKILDLEKVVPGDDGSLVRAGYPREVGYVDASTYGYAYNSAEDGFNPQKYLRAIRKRLWFIIVIPIIVTAIVTIEAFRPKPLYLATTTIEIKKDSWVLVRSGDTVITDDDPDIGMSSVTLKTNILNLRSRPLLQDVVANLNLEQNPNFFDVTHKKQSYWETLKHLGNSILGKSQTAKPRSVRVSEAPEAQQALADKASPKQVEQPARTDADKARLIPFVRVIDENLSIDPIKDTRALAISFTHTDPKTAAAVANGVAETFLKRSFQNKTAKFTSATAWLERSTNDLKEKVREAEQALADYCREHNIFAPEGRGSLTSDNVSRLHGEVMRAETDRILKESLYQEVKAGRVEQLPEAFSDPRAVELQSKLNQLEVEAAKLDISLGRRNPRVVDIRQQITTIKSQLETSRKALEDKLLAEYSRAQRDEQSLRGALERAKAEAVEQNQAGIQYNILKQDVDTGKALYTEFLQKTNQANIQLAQQPNSVRVIEPAEIPTQVVPNRLLTILLGFALSLGACIGLALVLEQFNRTIRSIEDVDRYVQLPAIGVIPQIKAPKAGLLSKNGNRNGSDNASTLGIIETRSNHMLATDARSSVAEAYRAVSASVLLSTGGTPPKTILVTSGLPGEGKTTTVMNTAISLAQLGASVLIIDCDLRNPTSHKLFGIDHTKGLSTYLSTENDLDGLIYKLDVPSLSLLPSGPVPNNPAKLILSQKMKDMLQILSERYDHVMIDSPPLIGIKDPVILSTLVDGVILVVHGGKSTRDIARRTRQELWNVGANIFGVVLNNMNYHDYYYYQPSYQNGNTETEIR